MSLTRNLPSPALRNCWVSNARRRLTQLAVRCWAGLFEFVLPSVCPFCGGAVDLSVALSGGKSSDGRATRLLKLLGLPAVVPLCDSCRSAALSTVRPGCPRCGMPVGPYADTSNGCLHCRRRRFRFAQVVRLGTYVDWLRAACVRAKDPGGYPLGVALAVLLWQEQGERLREVGPDFVVPVPQHWTKRLTSTHNSAAVVATVLARYLKVPFRGNILAKVRLTPDQSSLPAEKRRQNLSGAFRVKRPSAVRGRTVLLVDDILTTGTTADRCAEVLRRAGAERVVVAVVAVVPKHA